MTEKRNSSSQKSGPASRSRKARQIPPAGTATAILRDMVLSLLETGFEKQYITDALGKLADEARGDHWQTLLDGRERARLVTSAARRKEAEKQFQR